MNDDFDREWKFAAVRIAVMEFLEVEGEEIKDPKRLFDRAKYLYNKGYEARIDKWKTYWKDDKKPGLKKKKVEKKENVMLTQKAYLPKPKKGAPKIIIKGQKEAGKVGMKKCPKCKGLVLSTWAEHRYTSKGQPCGHEFKEEE